MIRVLDLEYPEHPYLNLALEEAIALAIGKRVVPETLRFWRNANAIVIGRFQCPSLEVNFEECISYKVRVERRFTGGGAVYHDLGNLNFALALRRNNPLIGEKLFRGFELLGKAVEFGLRSLGVKDVHFKSVNSVLIGKKKVSGMSGLIAKEFIFVHGSILVSSDLELLDRVLKAPYYNRREKFVRSKWHEVTTIEKALKRDVELEEIKRAIIEGLRKVLGYDFREKSIMAFERTLARNLYNEKYSKPEWSLGPCTMCPRKRIDEIIFKELTLNKIHQADELF